MNDQQVINIPRMCCHCNSTKKLIETEVSLQYLKYHFFFVKVYRIITLRFFICTVCQNRLKKHSNVLNRNISLALIAIACLSFIVFGLISSPTNSNGNILVISTLLLSLALISIPINLYEYRDSLWVNPRISFLPPVRIVFPNSAYSDLFNTLNKNLKL